nr:HNH endonuclease family protein [Streptomyces sp. NBRC 109706]
MTINTIPGRTLSASVLATVLTLTAVACTEADDAAADTSTSGSPSAPADDANPPADDGSDAGGTEAGDALALLAELEVAAEDRTGYDRDLFDHWSSQGNNCNTREAVLARDGQDVETDDQCRATAGTWESVYDGETWTDAADLDIDHVVPLAEAWDSGADTWTDEEREAFANDLDGPQLLAVTSSVNRAKGDKDPAEWMPPLESYHCTYAADWIQVKHDYGLAVDQDEHDALTGILESC